MALRRTFSFPPSHSKHWMGMGIPPVGWVEKATSSRFLRMLDEHPNILHLRVVKDTAKGGTYKMGLSSLEPLDRYQFAEVISGGDMDSVDKWKWVERWPFGDDHAEQRESARKWNETLKYIATCGGGGESIVDWGWASWE